MQVNRTPMEKKILEVQRGERVSPGPHTTLENHGFSELKVKALVSGLFFLIPGMFSSIICLL